MRTVLPWKGSDADGGFADLRTLILGESHYGEEGQVAEEFTRNVVKEHVEGKLLRRSGRFFTVVQNVVCGTRGGRPLHERKEFWDQVWFANVVQRVMTSNRHRPSEKDWREAGTAVRETINEVDPDLVLIFSRAAVPWVRPLLQERTWAGLPHPAARGFRPAEHHKTVREVLDKARTVRPPASGS